MDQRKNKKTANLMENHSEEVVFSLSNTFKRHK